MPQVMKQCKVCGKEYKACNTPNTTGNFRWRDVACCEEHAREYLAAIMASREKKPEQTE